MAHHIPLENASEGPQYHPQLHLLLSTTSKNPHAMAKMGKLDHLEERLRAIEGGEDYAFANLEELSRVNSWKDLVVAFVRQCQYNVFG